MRIYKTTCKYKLMALFLGCILILSGCASSSTKNSTSVKNISAKDIAAKIKSSLNLTEMTQIDDKKLKKLYGISTDEIDSYCIFVSMSNIKADEIAVIKVKSSSDAESIKEKIQKRNDAEALSFKDYLPEQYTLIQNHILKSNGNYILYAVSKDTEKIENTFDSFFK